MTVHLEIRHQEAHQKHCQSGKQSEQHTEARYIAAAEFSPSLNL